MPGGRPSKYQHRYCDRVIELGREGKSLVEIACEIAIARSTLDEWARTHPEFSEALSRAKQEGQAWWERQGRENLSNREFNAHLWIKTMQARFREDYTDRREVDTTVRLTHEERVKALEALDVEAVDVSVEKPEPPTPLLPAGHA